MIGGHRLRITHTHRLTVAESVSFKLPTVWVVVACMFFVLDLIGMVLVPNFFR